MLPKDTNNPYAKKQNLLPFLGLTHNYCFSAKIAVL